MGEIKHIRLTVRFARQIAEKDVHAVQDAIHYGFRPCKPTHNCSKGADGNSVNVKVDGDVDVGTLYDRLKKIGSSVEIESVIPEKMMDLEEDMKKKMMDLEKDLKSENKTTRKTNQRLLSEKKSLAEDKKRLLSENKSLDEHNKLLLLENKSLNEDKKRLLSENKSLDEDNKNLRRKIDELGTSVTSVKMPDNEKSIMKRDREHHIKQNETIVHLSSIITDLSMQIRISEDGRRDKKEELERLKQQLSQLIT